MRKRWNTKTFIEYCEKIHSYKYDYSLLEYKTLNNKIKIVCPKHGKFEQLANHHKRGSGCKKCALEKQIIKQKDTTESFIKKAQLFHSYKYNYSKTVYGKNAHDKVTIICSVHGEFKQSPNAHLVNGGCKKCGNEKSIEILKKNNYHSWSKTNWRKRCKNKIAKLYIIKIWNENETFFKIGITSKSNIKRRFTKIPYNWTLLRVIESENSDYIFDLEKRMLRMTKDRKYNPKIRFEGYTECRKILNIRYDK